MSQVKVERERFPWILVIGSAFLIAILSLFWHLWGFSGLGFYNSLSVVNNITAVTGAEWLLLFLAWPFSRIFKKKINQKTLAYLYIIGVCAAFSTLLVGDPFLDIVGNRVQGMSEQESLTLYAWFLAPSRGTVMQLLKGGVAFPAAEWFPVLAFWWIFTLMPFLLMIGIVTLFRRSWLDVERVPFPLTLVTFELLKRIPYDENRKLKLFSSPFLIGFVVGILFQVPVSLIQLFPWFPDIFSIRGNCCGFVWYVRAGTPLASIVGLGTANLQPLMTAVSYFIPLSILFNSWFWYLVYIILMQVAFMMGYYTGADTAGGCGRGWCAGFSGLESPPFNFMAVSESGGLVGLTIFSVWLSRRYLRETIMTALGKTKGDAQQNIEQKEAMSYRSAWLLVLLGFFGTMAVFMTAGVSAWPAFLVPVTYFVYLYANMRVYGLSGGHVRGFEHGQALERLLVWPMAPTPYNGGFMLVAQFTRVTVDPCGGKVFGASDGAFASYRMAELTNLGNRNALKAMLVAAVIIPILSMSLWVWVVGYSSYSAVMKFPNNWGQGYRWVSPWNDLPAKGNWVPYFFAGIVIVGVLSLLHARFLWFPFEPIGFLNGTSYNSLISGLWLPYLIAWVLKALTLRIGGSKLYENYGVPLASGSVGGMLLVYFILGVVGMVRFFHPF